MVDTVQDCYRALGLIHTTWSMVPGRFKDYISTPKQNDYRSVHTTIIGPSRQRIELQIRTRAMDEIAEFGVAAHSIYKDRGSGNNPHAISTETNAYAWLRQTIEQLSEGDNPEEFLEHTKLELFQDQVFCFTPKGRLIALPRGATPIDFAYAVHTDIGDSCVGAKVNGRIMPLMTELKNGDEVDIIRPRRRCRRQHGNLWSQPVRRVPPSVARRAPPCASNIPALACAFWNAPSNAPESRSARIFLNPACRDWRARM